MRRLIALSCLLLGLGPAARAESMASYNAASAQRSFNSYIASGSHNYGTDPAKLRERMQQSFPARPEPSRYSAPSLPNGYWNGYTPPVFVDTRSPQQKVIDAAGAGNTIAMWNLGLNYLAGKNGFAQSAESGIFWLKTAFERGKAEAATQLYYQFDPDWFSGESTIKKDAIQSLYWLQKAAKAGDANAMTILGGRTLQGAGVDPDAVEGVRLLKAALQAGDNGALITLEAAYEWGWGVKKDMTEAVKWQREKVKRGMSDDKADLIQLLVETEDPKHRANTAEIQTLIASEPANQELQLLHARLADTDVLGSPDPAKCVALCQQIIAKNDLWGAGIYHIREARYLLADHLFEGSGILKDNAAAYHLYRAAAAVENLSQPPSARSNFYFATLLSGCLSMLNADGTKTVIDEPKTALPLLFAAEDTQEFPLKLRAQAALLGARDLANHPELEKDPDWRHSVVGQLELARGWDRDTAFSIALGMRSGWFGAADKDRSRWLVEKIADSGDQPAAFWLVRWTCEDSEGKDPSWQADLERLVANKNWDAHLWMCDMLTEGKYLPKDLARTEALLRVAATEGNNPEAQNRLGLALWRGTFAEKKVTEGVGWLEQSLQNGLWIAGRNLAKIYHLGLDVEKNETKARAFLENAGAIGGPDAAEVVAAAYEKGDIIDADPSSSARWRATLEN